MRFDGTITLGTLLQIASMGVLAVALFNALSARMTIFENSLKDHAAKLDGHETKILDLIENIQFMRGQDDARWGRRSGDRPT